MVEKRPDFDAAVAAEADARAYLARCADVRAKAIEKVGPDKYAEAMASFEERGGLDDATLRSVIEGADDPVAAVMEIAGNPAEHQKLLRLSGSARVMAAHKIAASAAHPARKTTSSGGTETDPPAGADRATFNLYGRTITPKNLQQSPWEGQKGESNANDDAWYAERAKQKAKSAGRPWSPRR